MSLPKGTLDLDRPRHMTRIVATLGPASSSEDMIGRLIDHGVHVFRLNFSHGSHEEHQKTYETIRRLADERSVTVAVLQDLPGPKLRIHQFKDDYVELKVGDRFRLDTTIDQGDESGVGFHDDGWMESVRSGDRVLLGDGVVQLRVIGRDSHGFDTEVTAGGIVRSRQGMNFPDSDLELGAVTASDWRNVEFGLELGVDAIALSFVQGPEDLIAVRRYVQARPHPPMIVAKIEQPRAVTRIDEIIANCDGIMVARGDLGITLPIERIPVVQKHLIRKARRAGKFVITATQMLESMTQALRPTRAEVTDVANAVYDGTDAVMLSGETAVGEHPDKVVDTMARVLRETEPEVTLPAIAQSESTIDASMSMAVKELVTQLDARAVLVPISQGSTARRLSRQRMGVPILVGVSDPRVARRIIFRSGVIPVPIPDNASLFENLKRVLNFATAQGVVSDGDRAIVAGGFPLEQQGHTNFVRALTVGGPI